MKIQIHLAFMFFFFNWIQIYCLYSVENGNGRGVIDDEAAPVGFNPDDANIMSICI